MSIIIVIQRQKLYLILKPLPIFLIIFIRKKIKRGRIVSNCSLISEVLILKPRSPVSRPITICKGSEFSKRCGEKMSRDDPKGKELRHENMMQLPEFTGEM